MEKPHLFWKIVLTALISAVAPLASLMTMLILLMSGAWGITTFACMLVLPLLIPLIWLKKRKVYAIAYGAYILCVLILGGVQYGIHAYNESITIDISPSINVREYLPFDEHSKIVRIDSQELDFYDAAPEELPIIDGAAAAFPVYSAFVHAVYPHTTTLYDGIFEYNNTVHGYRLLAEKQTDLFIGAYPSEEQIAYAAECGTVFKYTQIGHEAFVFFVHKDNPVENLTLEQIRGIYSGEITNWSQVGGNDEPIVAFQRNEGSGSQSMLIRLMGDTPIMEPEMKEVVGGMGGIIEEVADYKNRSTSIGFSFRFYVEGIIQNPDIKMIAVDGVAPTKENIQNGSYSIIAPVYAVTYEGNPKENVYKLIDWIVSEEGQYIIDQTGYVGLGND